MPEWMVQWYAKVPGVLAVKLKLAPLASVPLSKVVPSSDVTVWATPSLFFQVTVVPAFTVSVAGPNAMATIDTELPEGGGFEPPVVVSLDLLQNQFIKTMKVAAARNTIILFCFMIRVLNFK